MGTMRTLQPAAAALAQYHEWGRDKVGLFVSHRRLGLVETRSVGSLELLFSLLAWVAPAP